MKPDLVCLGAVAIKKSVPLKRGVDFRNHVAGHVEKQRSQQFLQREDPKAQRVALVVGVHGSAPSARLASRCGA